MFDRQAEELVHQLAEPARPGIGARTLLTVAREDPAAFVLLWRHAPASRSSPRTPTSCVELAVGAVRDLMRISSDDPAFDAWSAEVVIGWLVEAVLTWLEVGDPTRAIRELRGAGRPRGCCRMRTGWVDAAIPFSP